MDSVIGEIRALVEWIRDELKEFQPPKPDHDYLILCAEVGQMRSKAALLKFKSRGGTLKSLELDILEKNQSSKEFFGANNFDYFISWISCFTQDKQLDGLALSLGCPVKGGHTAKTHPSWEWPHNLKEELFNKLGIDNILLLNDAVAFAFGCLERRSNKKMKLPILCLTLGGGIGCALISKPKSRIHPFEVDIISQRWPTGFEGTPYQFAGQPFFNWVETSTNYSFEETNQVYSRHIAWILCSLKEQFLFQSVIIGGGRASRLDEYELSQTLLKEEQKYKIGEIVE